MNRLVKHRGLGLRSIRSVSSRSPRNPPTLRGLGPFPNVTRDTDKTEIENIRNPQPRILSPVVSTHTDLVSGMCHMARDVVRLKIYSDRPVSAIVL